jgi:hypothetical protein
MNWEKQVLLEKLVPSFCHLVGFCFFGESHSRRKPNQRHPKKAETDVTHAPSSHFLSS